jgi:ribonuclease Z
MELIFLGTSSGTPTNQRNVSATAIKMAGSKSWCLVDCGEGTQQQILKTKLSLNKLAVIFITHLHGDHCYGLPGLLASATMSGRTDDLYIVGPEATQDFFENIQKHSQMRLSYQIQFIAVEETDALLQFNDFDVEIVGLSHRISSFAYGFIEKNIRAKLNVDKLKNDGIATGSAWSRLHRGEDVLLENGRLLKSNDYVLEKRQPRKIIIAGDNDKPQLLESCAKTADVLVHEATYTDEVAQIVGPAPQHSSAKMVAEFAQSRQLNNLVLMHFSPRYQTHASRSHSIFEIQDEAQKHYNGHLFLANDFDCLHLNSEGLLTLMTKQ